MFAQQGSRGSTSFISTGFHFFIISRNEILRVRKINVELQKCIMKFNLHHTSTIIFMNSKSILLLF